MFKKVKFVYLKGARRTKQSKADDLGADLYVELHFNAHDAPQAKQASYGLALVPVGADQKTGMIASTIVSAIAGALETPTFRPTSVFPGVLPGGFEGRGMSLISHFRNGPAILLEPAFVSNRVWADKLVQPKAQELLARTIYKALIEALPVDGGLIALSCGHLFDPTDPRDKGAAVAGHPKISEGEIADKVLCGVMKLYQESVDKVDVEVGGYTAAVNFVLGRGLMTGSLGRFEGARLVTRYEMAVILERAYKDMNRAVIEEVAKCMKNK